MKTGANKLDQSRIAAMVKDKKDVEEISAALRIDEKCVKSFVDFFKSGKTLGDLNSLKAKDTEKAEKEAAEKAAKEKAEKEAAEKADAANKK